MIDHKSTTAAAIYTRVSTQEQVTEGYSLGAQSDKLRQYANGMSYHIVDLYSDEGFSGASMLRPALQRLIEDIKGGRIRVVLIYKLDRLSRKVKDILDLVELFAKYNVTLFSLTENLDLSSPFGRAALKMSATFSELERETITERMMLGKLAAVKQGKYMVPGKAPYGYRYDRATKSLVQVPEEIELVKKCYELYTSGYSFRKIYEFMRMNHSEAKYFQTNNMSAKPIIVRPLYAGYFLFKGEIYKATNIEPCISYDTWIQANKLRKERPGTKIHEDSPYLLTGLLYCGKCFSRYVCKVKDHKVGEKRYRYVYYGCSERMNHNIIGGKEKCDNEMFTQPDLDAHIIDAVKAMDFQEFKQDSSLSQTSLDYIQSEITELKLQKEKLLDLYMEQLIDKDAFILRIAKIDEKIANNDKLLQFESDKPITPSNAIIDFLKQQIASFDELTIAEKRRLLHLLIKQIEINGKKAVINWRVQ